MAQQELEVGFSQRVTWCLSALLHSNIFNVTYTHVMRVISEFPSKMFTIEG